MFHMKKEKPNHCCIVISNVKDSNHLHSFLDPTTTMHISKWFSMNEWKMHDSLLTEWNNGLVWTFVFSSTHYIRLYRWLSFILILLLLFNNQLVYDLLLAVTAQSHAYYEAQVSSCIEPDQEQWRIPVKLSPQHIRSAIAHFRYWKCTASN